MTKLGEIKGINWIDSSKSIKDVSITLDREKLRKVCGDYLSNVDFSDAGIAQAIIASLPDLIVVEEE